jgi:hypothetical protein
MSIGEVQLQQQQQHNNAFGSPPRWSTPTSTTAPIRNNAAVLQEGSLQPNDHNVSFTIPRILPVPASSGSSTSSAANHVTSHLSLSTTSSRNTGLFRHNPDDDNSTGSMLYFMGGEVVVRRDAPPLTSSSHMGVPSQQMVAISREESNFSLPSTSSDAVGVHGFYNGHTAVGLDVSESRRSYDDDDDDDDDFVEDFASIPHATSSADTVPSSNITPHPSPKKLKVDTSIPDTGSDSSDQFYAHESGGLQAILESRLTPRHRNCQHQQDLLEQHHQPSGMLSEVGNIVDSNTLPNQMYQRTPPTFPDLRSNKGR